MDKNTIVIGRCHCGGYGQCLSMGSDTCHRGVNGDIFGHYVTAKLKGKDDCRQGIVINLDPLIIKGSLGEYECEGIPTAIMGDTE